MTEYYNLIYQYKMDCLVAGIEYKKDYYNDIGVEPSEKYIFNYYITFQSSVDLPELEIMKNYYIFKLSILCLFFLYL